MVTNVHLTALEDDLGQLANAAGKKLVRRKAKDLTGKHHWIIYEIAADGLTPNGVSIYLVEGKPVDEVTHRLAVEMFVQQMTERGLT